jgi:uncharacterized protein (DUF1499 family)
MNDSASVKRPRGTRWCSIGIVAAAIGAVSVIVGLGGARFGLFGPLTAFSIFGVALISFIVSLVTDLVGLLISKGSAGAASSQRAWAALILSVLFFGASLSQASGGFGGPPIHDISTDLGNPPTFDAILVYRKDAPNPPEYAGGKTAELQRAAYPDIQTLTVEKSPDEVLAAAEQVAKDLGWEVIAVDPKNGRIEAIATTPWIRFKDDVSIRLTARGYGTYVDIRSKSRIGQGDMGANAARVRAFLERLEETTGG